MEIFDGVRFILFISLVFLSFKTFSAFFLLTLDEERRIFLFSVLSCVECSSTSFLNPNAQKTCTNFSRAQKKAFKFIAHRKH